MWKTSSCRYCRSFSSEDQEFSTSFSTFAPVSQQPGAIKADFQAMDAAIKKKKRRRCDDMIVMFGSKNFHSSLGNGVAGMMGFFMILHGTSKWGHSWHLLANQNSAETCCPLRSSGACGSYLYFSSGQRLAEVGYVGFHVPNFKKCREKKGDSTDNNRCISYLRIYI